MKLYKSPDNRVYAYEEDGSQDDIIPADYVPITKAEADAINAANEQAAWNALPDDYKKDVCKRRATELLAETDWATMPDVIDPANTPHLVNQQDFLDWRGQIRQYAVNPQTNWTFPEKPTAVWE